MDKYYGSLVENNKPVSGIWFVDDSNLTFNKRSIGAVVWFGLMADTMTTGQKYLSIPLSEVTGIEYFKFRLNKNAIRLTTSTKIYEIVADKHQKLFHFIEEKIKK